MWVSPIQSCSFPVLICLSRCRFQNVSAHRSVPFYCVLTCSSRCGLQRVSPVRSVTFFCPPDLSSTTRSPESECPSLGPILSLSGLVPYDAVSRECVPFPLSYCSCILTFHSRCGLHRQRVSSPHPVAFSMCPYLSLPMWSPESECPPLGPICFRVLTYASRCNL